MKKNKKIAPESSDGGQQTRWRLSSVRWLMRYWKNWRKLMASTVRGDGGAGVGGRDYSLISKLSLFVPLVVKKRKTLRIDEKIGGIPSRRFTFTKGSKQTNAIYHSVART